MTLRDTTKEASWNEHPIIGYVPLDKDGKPYQAKLSNRYHGSETRKKPVTLYQTMARAVSYSPVDAGAEVRMFQPIEVQS